MMKDVNKVGLEILRPEKDSGRTYRRVLCVVSIFQCLCVFAALTGLVVAMAHEQVSLITIITVVVCLVCCIDTAIKAYKLTYEEKEWK